MHDDTVRVRFETLRLPHSLNSMAKALLAKTTRHLFGRAFSGYFYSTEKSGDATQREAE